MTTTTRHCKDKHPAPIYQRGQPYVEGTCRYCWLVTNSSEVAEAWGEPLPPMPDSLTTLNLLPTPPVLVPCRGCNKDGSNVRFKVHANMRVEDLMKLLIDHPPGSTTDFWPPEYAASFAGFEAWPVTMEARRRLAQQKGLAYPSVAKETTPPLSSSTPGPHRHKPLKWAYGVTTVPQRRDTLLSRTLISLAAAGFARPRLFVDGWDGHDRSYTEFKLEVTSHYPTIRTMGNWCLGLAELYLRDPWADRYAMFQDDLVTYRNLRSYLEAIPYPTDPLGYLNLYTFPQDGGRHNQLPAPKNPDGSPKTGWYLSNQKGKGALALVFDRKAVVALLTHHHMVERVQDIHRGHRAIDGGIVTAMNQLVYKEYVHHPSLTQHEGYLSTMGNKPHPTAPSFLGESIDAMSFIPVVSSSVATK